MNIDLASLSDDPAGDPFERRPIKLMESLDVAAGAARDLALVDPAITAPTGTALSRVIATKTTPRMRQLLAIMGWTPLNPATDEQWILNEPIALPPNSNTLLAEVAAKSYADALTRLFPLADGEFEGMVVPLDESGHESLTALRAVVKTMAERSWISVAYVARYCPASVLYHWVGQDVERVNRARMRCNLASLSQPSMTTIQRWCHIFSDKHEHRSGVRGDWRNYRPEPTRFDS